MGSKTFAVCCFADVFFIFVVDVIIVVAAFRMESREVFRSGVQESVTRVTGRAA